MEVNTVAKQAVNSPQHKSGSASSGEDISTHPKEEEHSPSTISQHQQQQKFAPSTQQQQQSNESLIDREGSLPLSASTRGGVEEQDPDADDRHRAGAEEVVAPVGDVMTCLDLSLRHRSPRRPVLLVSRKRA